MCFNSVVQADVPQVFHLGDKEIHLTDYTKVLGVILDKKLNFKEHSKAIYNKLVYRWICMSRYSNRNWGMNQLVIVRVFKAILFSSLFYGSMIWMSPTNLKEINTLWYKIAKAATGAIFNVSGTILNVILSLPPLLVTAKIIALTLKADRGSNFAQHGV